MSNNEAQILADQNQQPQEGAANAPADYQIRELLPPNSQNITHPPQVAAPEREVAHVAIKMAPFWTNDPEAWFLQLEANFELSRVTVDRTKISHLIMYLPQDVLSKVKHIIRTGSYATIRDRLIDLYSKSQDETLAELFTKMQLGDRKPSLMLAEMEGVARDHQIPPDVIKHMWFERLDSHTQRVLLPVKDSETSKLAKIADAIIRQAPGGQLYEVQKPIDPQTEIQSLRNETAELRRELTKQYRNSARSRSRTPSKRDPNKHPLCYYHFKYGDAAKKCEKPCTSAKN